MKQCGMLAALCRNLDRAEEELNDLCKKVTCKKKRPCKQSFEPPEKSACDKPECCRK